MEAFLEGMRAYFPRYAFGNATLAEMKGGSFPRMADLRTAALGRRRDRRVRHHSLCADLRARGRLPAAGVRGGRRGVRLSLRLLRGDDGAPGAATVEEDADSGSHQTQDTGNGRRGDGTVVPIVNVVHPEGDKAHIVHLQAEGSPALSVGETVRLEIDWDRLRDTINARTRLLILNFPHNPTGATVADRSEREPAGRPAAPPRKSPASEGRSTAAADDAYVAGLRLLAGRELSERQVRQPGAHSQDLGVQMLREKPLEKSVRGRLLSIRSSP